MNTSKSARVKAGPGDLVLHQSTIFGHLGVTAAWRIRAVSFKAFIREVVSPLERENGEPLKCLDIGAGNGWLSNQLALRGHKTAAVDLITNDWDGLGVYVNYSSSYLPVQAEFDTCPFLIINAILLYITHPFITLLTFRRHSKKPCGL
jgi:hypothetical protein